MLEASCTTRDDDELTSVATCPIRELGGRHPFGMTQALTNLRLAFNPKVAGRIP